jgi:serine/threonine protein kinase
VQSLKAGAFDYIVKKHASRDLIVSSVASALQSRGQNVARGDARSAIDVFGYETGRRLAASGNVSVHVAFSAERNEDVVIKVLHRGRGSLALDVHFQRFVDEFKILFDIDDPSIAEIYDFRVTEQYCYIAMEYFRRGHLGTILTGGPLDVSEALRLGGEIAQALSIIHTAGVIHRDLKPGNIMLRDDGSIALIDFGISQSAALLESKMAGMEPVMAGTPYYMSPEQIEGKPTDERTDLYSLGVILFQMLSGKKPYVGETFEAIVAQHSTPDIPLLPENLSPYQDLINRLLAPDAAARLGSARELAEIVESLRDSIAEEESQSLASASSA